MGSLTLLLLGFYRLPLALSLFATAQNRAAQQKQSDIKRFKFFSRASRRSYHPQHTASLAAG